MQIADFEKRFENYAPGIMNSRGEFAVLVPLVQVGDKTHILYEVRSKNIPTQPNEVCFPGGAMEAGETPEICALRETWEEIGVPPEDIKVISRLDTLHPNHGLLIHPVLAEIKNFDPEKLDINPEEVGEVFTVPTDFLMGEPYVYTVRDTTMPGEDFPYERMGITRDYRWRKVRDDVVLYEYGGHPIWGMTAMITRWLMERMK